MPAKSLIAIVEDDASLRPALVGFVRSMGYEGEGYESAEAFLESGAQARTDCLVSDLQLPGISGLELIERLGGAVPTILVTARTEAIIDERARQAGLTCLLRKPFEIEELASCLRRALDS